MSKFNLLRFIFFISLVGLAALALSNPIIWIVFSFILIVGFTLLIISVFRLDWQLFTSSSCKLSSENILLTFDDGPNEHTLEVLEVLKKHHLEALFFVIGRQVEKHPEIAKKIINEGHLIGNHSYHHFNADAFKSKVYWMDEIEKTNHLIEKITGYKPTHFRPPFGVMNPTIAKACTQMNMKVVGWSFRSYDTVKPQNQVLDKLKTLEKGNILLFHDNLANSASLIDAVITQLKLKGFIFAEPQEL